MPLPDQFNQSEHLQDTIRRTYNKDVREWFSDLPAELDLNTPRASLRVACTHQDADSFTETVARQLLFDMAIKQQTLQLQTSSTTDLNYRILRRNKPKIILYFLEDREDVDAGYKQVEGTIGIRIMNETTTTLTKANIITLANKIKTIFGTAGGFRWHKGKGMFSYSDWDKGYQLQLLCYSKSEGRRIVEQVLDVQGHSPDWENAQWSESEQPSESYPTIPPSETILGKRRKLPRRRPTAQVRFQFATMMVSGLASPVVLYDRSGRYRNPLVR